MQIMKELQVLMMMELQEVLQPMCEMISQNGKSDMLYLCFQKSRFLLLFPSVLRPIFVWDFNELANCLVDATF